MSGLNFGLSAGLLAQSTQAYQSGAAAASSVVGGAGGGGAGGGSGNGGFGRGGRGARGGGGRGGGGGVMVTARGGRGGRLVRGDGGGGRGRRPNQTPYSKPGSHQPATIQGPGPNTHTISVTNPGSCSKEEMITALTSQCREPFAVTEYLVRPDCFFFTLAQDNSRAVNELVRMSSRLNYKGQQLNVRRPQHRPTDMRPLLKKEAKDLLLQVLSSKYNALEHILDLSNLVPALASAGLCPPEGVTPSVWDAIAGVVSEHCGDMIALDLSGDFINTLATLRPVFDASRNLTALNLSNNLLKSLDDLAHLRPLGKLTTLLLAGNPCAADRLALEAKLRKALPSLSVLDGTALSPTADQLLPSVQDTHVPDLVTAMLGAFGLKFFTLFDNDRLRLLNVYTDRSSFSITMPPQSQSVRAMLKYSRNLLKSVGRNRVYFGASSIVKVLQELPKTAHNMASLKVDVWQMHVTALCLDIRGEMSAELNFHRVFILEPVEQGTTAATEGWPAVVISDQLHIYPRPSGAAAGAKQGGAVLAARALAAAAGSN